MPGRKSLTDYDCSLARTADIIGDAWSLLIIRDAAIGARRFGEFRASLGVAKNILSSRLKRLIAGGILTIEDGDYRLTEQGWQLLPALVALMQWGDRWTFGGAGPVEIRDDRDVGVEAVQLRAGKAAVPPQHLRFRASATASQRTANFLRLANERREDEASRDDRHVS